MDPSIGGSGEDGPTSTKLCETPDELSSPDDPPPSCHPLLLADDEFRSAYIATRTREFHRELYRKLEKIASEVDRRPTSRKRKRGSEGPSSGHSTASAASQTRRNNTQDTCTTIDTPATASTLFSESNKRFRKTNGHYATPPSSNSPDSTADSRQVKADFSWWRALTPTPPASPRMTAMTKPIESIDPIYKIYGHEVIAGHG